MCVCDVCIGTSGMHNRREEVCLVVMAPSPASVGSFVFIVLGSRCVNVEFMLMW